jgi:hypothetical protein
VLVAAAATALQRAKKQRQQWRQRRKCQGGGLTGGTGPEERERLVLTGGPSGILNLNRNPNYTKLRFHPNASLQVLENLEKNTRWQVLE